MQLNHNYFLDTSIIIDFIRLKQDSNLKNFLTNLIKNKTIFFSISTITIAELFSGKSIQSRKVRSRLENIINACNVINFDKKIAMQSGIFKIKYKLSLPDAIIASSVYFSKSTLISKDKLFTKVKEIKSQILS